MSERSLRAHADGSTVPNEPRGGVAGDEVVEGAGAKTAAARSDERFRLTQEISPDGLAILDPIRDRTGSIVDFVYQYVNPAAAHAIGHAVGELIGHRLLERMPTSVETSEAFERYSRVIERSEADDVELYDGSEGHEAWFRRVATPLSDSLVLRLSDITARKREERRRGFLVKAASWLSDSSQAEEVLERLSALAAQHFADCSLTYLAREEGQLRPIGVAHVDPSRVDALVDLERHIPRDPIRRIVHSVMGRAEVVADLDIDVDRISDWAHDGAIAAAVRHILPRSGIAAPVVGRDRTYGVLVVATVRNGQQPFDSDDVEVVQKIARLAGLVVDNARLLREERHARSEAERRVREERALLQATAAILASSSVERVTEEIAQSALEAVHADSAVIERAQGNESFRIVASTGVRKIPPGIELRYAGTLLAHLVESREPELIPHLSDTELSVSPELLRACGECSALAVPLAQAGESIGALLLLREPTKPLFKEEEIGRASVFANLASLAFRRVSLLEEAQRGKEELQEATELRERVVRGFSHDLKNPLGAARGHLDLLQMGLRGKLTEEQAESVSRIRTAVSETLRLIDEIVEVAHAEAGRLELEPESIAVSETVDQVVSLYRPQARSAQLTLEVSIPHELPTVETDGARVRQILGNLLSNAIKYTPAGGRIEITAELPDPVKRDDGRWIAIAVRDTGAGIPRERHAELFQEFGRLAATDEPGSGIGLAISQRLARTLGGEITVESEVGVGSTFTLWLPAEDQGPR